MAPIQLSVVIPAYNEGESIYQNLVKLDGVLKKLGKKYEIILVDDGSSDNTVEEVNRARKKLKALKIVESGGNNGKGHALRLGSDFISGDFVTFIDADNELNPEQIGVFFEYLEEHSADIVIGSKRHPLTRISYPFLRRCLSKIYNMFVNFVFNLKISDTQAGLKLFKRKVLNDILPKLRVKRYAFDVEFLAYANKGGYSIVEAPIVVDFSRGGWGRIRIRDIVYIFLETMGVAKRFRIPNEYAFMIRESGIMLFLFGIGIMAYKEYLNPNALPGIEARLLYALIGMGAILLILMLPYDRIAERIP